MFGEAFLTIEGTFVLAAGVRIRDEAAIPPTGARVEEEMVNDAIAKWGSDDFTNDRIGDDEGDTATRFVVATNEAIT